MVNTTLRALTGMTPDPGAISNITLVLIDCQQTYREGVMQLEGIRAALKEAASLLQRFRKAGRPVIHIIHDGGSGTPYDITARIGRIADVVAPLEGELIIAKKIPVCIRTNRFRRGVKKGV